MSNKSIQLTDDLYRYMLEHSVQEHVVLRKIREQNQGDHLTSIMQIAPEQGQFMALMIKLMGVKRVLEIGTSTGYSSLVMALALPEQGVIVTCDINESATNKAQQYWKEANVDHKVQLHLGPALETLQQLKKMERVDLFDLAFIDADKIHYDGYFECCMSLVKSGGLILIDNVLWGGSVADKSNNEADTLSIRALNKKLSIDSRVEISMLPLADGLTLVRKK